VNVFCKIAVTKKGLVKLPGLCCEKSLRNEKRKKTGLYVVSVMHLCQSAALASPRAFQAASSKPIKYWNGESLRSA
jgi:hypothetical protein